MSTIDDIVEYIVELCEREGRLELSCEVLADVIKSHRSELDGELSQAIAEKLISEGIKVV